VTSATPNEVTALFWDIGGVVLSNGWDEEARERAVQHFQLDRDDFETRHAASFDTFETGHITLAEYLNRAIFYRPRGFSREEFTAFIFAQSSEKVETHVLLDDLTASKKYLLAMLNNEGREINEYRIEKFGLARNFTLFLSSCYVGIRKPDEAIYRIAVDVIQRDPAACVFIDDRAENLVGAQQLGMRTIHFQNAEQLRAELAHNGVSAVV
jgi:putative hydrolase of the HAD superfamily